MQRRSLPADLIAAIEAGGPLPPAFRPRRGDAAAVAEAVARVADAATPSEERLALIRTLGELRRPEAAARLLPAGVVDSLTDGHVRDPFASLRIKQPIGADAGP